MGFLTFIFYSFLALFAYAAYSNTSLFLSKVFPGMMPWVHGQENDFRQLGLPGLHVLKRLVAAILKERKLEVALALFALIMLQVVFAGVMISSISNALTFIRVASGR